MSIQLYVSNSLEGLSEQLNQDIQRHSHHVFDPITIITQTEGMNTWLKQQVAQEAGIAANLQFVRPNDLIHRIYLALGGPYAQTFTVGNMAWLLYKILDEPDFIQQFPEVASFYDQEEDRDRKKMSLAEKLADLLDQYQIYRADYLKAWLDPNAPPMTSKPHLENWQRWLWQRIHAVAGEELVDKNAQGAFISKICRSEQSDSISLLQQKFPALFFFGISIITPYHIELIHALGQHIPVYFYTLNPAPESYWFDTYSEKQLFWLKKRKMLLPNEQAAGNPLLTGMGKIIRDTFLLFFEYDDFLNGYQEVGLLKDNAPLHSSPTLLHRIQQDISANADKSSRQRLAPTTFSDRSILVQRCYTMAREVEALYNYLVVLNDQMGVHFSPRQVLVMVSNIQAYAPYIRSVFENAPIKIPFQIADELHTDGNQMLFALQELLLLEEDDFKAETIVRLLDAAYIRERFGLLNTNLIRKTVLSANIRFGLKGEVFNETRLVSWEHGLKRILLGLCITQIENDDPVFWEEEEIFPLETVEGLESYEIIRFVHWIDVLQQSVLERKGKKSIVEWVEYVQQVLQHLVYEPEEAAEEEFTILVQQMEQYNAMHQLMDQPISFEVFIPNFLKSIGTHTKHAQFAGGGITFCSLIPMRSIPFQVVAMLGMNADQFPRQEVQTGFNLLELDKRRGDRSVKDNDKHLFLETILSARSFLYISYIGKSVKDNSSFPPSSLVDELLEYIQQGYLLWLQTEEAANEWKSSVDFYSDVKKVLVVDQPLHGFSRRSRGKVGFLSNYLLQGAGQPKDWWKLSNETLLHNPSAVGSEVSNVVKPIDLLNFYKEPYAAFFKKTLNIYYKSFHQLLPEQECFESDNLQDWKIKKSLLEVFLESLSLGAEQWDSLEQETMHEEWGNGVNSFIRLEGLRKQLLLESVLPLKNTGWSILKKHYYELQEQLNFLQQTFQHKEKKEPFIQIELPSGTIAGVLSGVWDRTLLEVCFSRSYTKYQLVAWIKGLMAFAAGVAEEVIWVDVRKEFSSKQNDQKGYWRMKPLSAQEAKKILDHLLLGYFEGLEQVFPFVPRKEFFTEKEDKFSPENFNETLNKVLFKDSSFSNNQDSDNTPMSKHLREPYIDLLKRFDLFEDEVVSEKAYQWLQFFRTHLLSAFEPVEGQQKAV